MAARMAMMAMTTRSSIKVNPEDVAGTVGEKELRCFDVFMCRWIEETLAAMAERIHCAFLQRSVKIIHYHAQRPCFSGRTWSKQSMAMGLRSKQVRGQFFQAPQPDTCFRIK